MSRGQHNTARAMTESAIICHDAPRQALAYIEGSHPDQVGMHHVLREARGNLNRGSLNLATAREAQALNKLAREALARYQDTEETAYQLACRFDEREYRTLCRSAICSLVREALGALDTFISLAHFDTLADWVDTVDRWRWKD